MFFLDRSSKMWCFSLVFSVLFVTVFDFVLMQYQNPCPRVFEYALDEHQSLYGRIKINNPKGNLVVLYVEISVGNSVKDYNGNIELAYAKARAVDEIVSGRPLYYKVFFPIWRGFPPRITKIMVNGELICSGPPLDIKRVPVLTTISLQHTLKINSLNLALSPDASFNDNNYYHQNGYNTNSHVNNNENRTPTNNNESGWFFHFGAADPSNPYPGNPFLTSNSNANNNNQFFNIPTNVQGNPFLGFLTTTKRPSVPSTPEPTTQRPIRISTRPLPTPPPHPPPAPTSPPATTSASPPPPEELPQLDVRGNLNDVCGKSLSTTSLIAHGTPVAEGYYPWLVALYNIKQLNLEFTCGGSLVSSKHIITAAHCLRPYENRVNIDQLLIILGKYNIQRWTNDKDSLMLSAETVNVHPDYRALSADADIAVITLTQEVIFRRFVRPICLWNDNTDLKQIEGDIGVVAGWGKDENGQTLTPEPNQVRLPIVSQVECLQSHDDFADVTSERTFCAGNRNGSGPCNGDSGGGFMMNRNGRWTLRGVVSMSIADQTRNCDLSQYLVFTDVSKFSNWILTIINK